MKCPSLLIALSHQHCKIATSISCNSCTSLAVQSSLLHRHSTSTTSTTIPTTSTSTTRNSRTIPTFYTSNTGRHRPSSFQRTKDCIRTFAVPSESSFTSDSFKDLSNMSSSSSFVSLESSAQDQIQEEEPATLQVVLPREQICCHRCHGEGQVPNRKQTRKSKKMKYSTTMSQEPMQTNTNITAKDDTNTTTITTNTAKISNVLQQRNMTPCSICHGTGLVPKQSSTMSHTKSKGQTYSYEPKVMDHVHIAIIGAGIGGLALALSLQQRNIPYTIYERDTSFDQRSQGYGLTMQQGGKALKALGYDTNSNGHRLFGKGIHSKRHLVHTPDGQVVGTWGMKVWGRPSNKKEEAKRQNVHIARQELRRLIYDQLVFKEEHIRWGHKLISYTQTNHSQDEDGNTCISMTFVNTSSQDGTTTTAQQEEVSSTATILVGADGIRSQVRSQKISDTISPLRYLGCLVILGIAPSPQSSTLTSDGESVFQTADGTTRLYAMPFAQRGKETARAYEYLKKERRNVTGEHDCIDASIGETMWQLSFPLSEKDAITLSSKGVRALKEEALNRVGHWHVPVPDLIEHTPLELITGYPVYDRDVVDVETFRFGDGSATEQMDYGRVTLIGDAAHPMSPFKGQGANQALIDAVLLSRTIYRIFRDQDCTTTRTDRASKPTDVHAHDNSSQICAELRKFEEQMMERSAVKMKASFDAAKFLHTDAAIAEGNVTRGAVASLQRSAVNDDL